MAKQREGFTFYRSYYDVYMELTDKEKVAFMDAVLNRQFNGVEPTGLKGMANFAYLSQKHSIDKQIKGFEDKTGFKLRPETPLPRGAETPSQQEEEKEEGKEQVQGKVEEEFNARGNANAAELDFSKFNNSRIEIIWSDWKQYKWNQHKEKYKSLKTEEVALKKLGELSEWKSEIALKIVEQSMSFLWKGLFQLKNNIQNGTKERITADEQIARTVNRALYGDQQPPSSEEHSGTEDSTFIDVTGF